MFRGLHVEKILLTIDDACDVLSLKKSKVYALVKEGSIPSVKVGKVIRIPADQLRDWIANLGEHAEVDDPAVPV
jgi:excisionase family DNA binding protein